MRNVELSSERIQQGFGIFNFLTNFLTFYDRWIIVTVNGKVIVTLLPVNASLPWITAATFRPELVPEELMAEGLTVTMQNQSEV